jgi:hypothetical protein
MRSTASHGTLSLPAVDDDTPHARKFDTPFSQWMQSDEPKPNRSKNPFVEAARSQELQKSSIKEKPADVVPVTQGSPTPPPPQQRAEAVATASPTKAAGGPGPVPAAKFSAANPFADDTSVGQSQTVQPAQGESPSEANAKPSGQAARLRCCLIFCRHKAAGVHCPDRRSATHVRRGG